MKSKPFKLAVAALVLGGCGTTTTIDEFRPGNSPAPIETGETIVVLGRRDAGHYETDRDFVDCVGKNMRGADINVMPEQQFIDAIYPWFEPRTAPKGLRRLTRLMQEPIIRAKISAAEVRYLVWLDGKTETQGKAGSMSCALGPAGGGCLGFTQWDKLSAYEATIWDLEDLKQLGRVRVDSEGTSYLIGVVAPIPLLTPVKNEACQGLGEQLKSYFTTEAG